MNTLIMTRAQYLELNTAGDRVSNAALHRQYFAQFVTEGIRNHVRNTIGVKAIADSKDEYLNDIPLHRWDQMQPSIMHLVNKSAWKEAHGHLSFSLSDTACIAKEAAQQIKESTKGCTVRVTCTNGNTWITPINVPFAAAVDYFMGKTFIREDDEGNETDDVVCEVTEVQS